MVAVPSKIRPPRRSVFDRLLSFRRRPAGRHRRPRRSWSVERLEDRTLLSALVVTSPLDTVDAGDGVTTLREAILAANAQAGHDTISFDIAGDGVQTIRPASALPTITDAVTIDGTTQPGFAGTPVIELDGSLSGFASGLVVTAGGSTIRGLAINRFGGSGIMVRTEGGNLIEGNHIGTDASGTTALGNLRQGIWIVNSSRNTIGGTAPGSGNLISANGGNGVTLNGADPVGNVILGNRIGTNAAGTAALGNGANGVFVSQGSGNIVGGTDAGAGNLISGNGWNGVILQNGSTGNLVYGNLIGTDAAGDGPLGNGQRGVYVLASAGNQIGGSPEQANVIAFNAGDGVAVFHWMSTGNTIRANSIHSNGGLGIDLGADGRTLNDDGDLDGGANLLQNFAHVSEAGRSDTQVRLAGTLNSTPGATFTLDFYASPAAEPDAFSGGARWLQSILVTTDETGNAAFEITFDATLAEGELVTATATDAAGNTSEFSPAVAAVTLEPTAAAAIERLIAQLEEWSASGVLSESAARMVTDSLEHALVKLQQGHWRPAANNLMAAGNKVAALVRSGRLSADEGASLLDEIDQTRHQIRSENVDASDDATTSGDLAALDEFFAGRSRRSRK